MTEQMAIPPEIERVLTTPHVHEHPIHWPPLWLIWKTDVNRNTGVPYFPELSAVCNDIDTARYHVAMALFDSPSSRLDVERIPANHRFGSSIGHLQMKSHMAIWKVRVALAGEAVQAALNAGAGDLRQVIDVQMVKVGGRAKIYELLRERGDDQRTRYWLKNGSEERIIPNDTAVWIRQQWALGQQADLDP